MTFPIETGLFCLVAMNKFFVVLTALFLCISLFAGGKIVHADESFLIGPVIPYGSERFNNDNWDILPHPRVAEFTIRTDGSAYGLTENGISFVQYYVPNDLGIRVQRFEIQDHYHYIVEGTIANSLQELSAQLALAYETRVMVS